MNMINNLLFNNGSWEKAPKGTKSNNITIDLNCINSLSS